MLTLIEINTLLRTAMVEAIQDFNSEIIIIPEAQEADPNASKILVIQAFKPELVTGAELGGRQGVSRLLGNYLVTLSVPKGNRVKMQTAWQIGQVIQEKTRRIKLGNMDYCYVYIDDPYITNSGETPDNRQALLVTIPWVTWTGGDANG